MALRKYDEWIQPEGLLKIEGWARDGLIDVQIAEKMGISKTTLYDWKKRFECIDKALKKGKEIVDRMVENALLKSALGYEYEEVEIYDNGTKKTKHIYRKHQPPNVTAQIYWLKNRKAAEWRDRPVEVSAASEKAHTDLVSAIRAIDDDD